MFFAMELMPERMRRAVAAVEPVCPNAGRRRAWLVAVLEDDQSVPAVQRPAR